MLNEFKDFIVKGNVMDMAVRIIIEVAFTAIVKSMVADLINLLISLFTRGIDFINLFVVLGEGEFATLAGAQVAGIATFAYGSFMMAGINFVIIAFVVFMLVKGVKKAKDAAEIEPAATPAPKGPTQEDLLVEIRDLLAKS